MHHANNCLTALSFVLGLLFTFAFTVRRVRRQVPVSLAVGGSAGTASATGAASETAGAAGAAASAKLTGGKPGSEAETAKIATAADGPYGPGSTKAGAGGSGPAGWTIKGNEDSMLYHGPASPAYDATVAEVWFRDEQTAQAAGFARWDSWQHKKK